MNNSRRPIRRAGPAKRLYGKPSTTKKADSGERKERRDPDAEDRPARPSRRSEEASEAPRRPAAPRADRPAREDRPRRDDREERPRAPRRDAGERSPRPRSDSRDRDERAPRRDGPPRSAGPRREGGFGDRPRAPRRDAEGSDRPRAPRREGSFGDRPRPARRDGEGSERPRGPRRESGSGDAPRAPRRDAGGFGDRARAPRTERPYRSGSRDERPSRSAPPGRGDRPFRPRGDGPAYRDDKAYYRPKGKAPKKKQTDNPEDGLVRLNRYLAQSGVGSRRAADDLIKAGAVTVNGVLVTTLGTKVHPNDKVVFGGQRVSMEQLRYVLLNKPKDTITTTDDPEDRHTVMSLISGACSERLYPVGRLDRNTTGVLLMTNDGDLAKKLTHPSHGAEKIYHVTLDKGVTAADLRKLTDGLMLDDGPAKADEANFVEGTEARREVGIQLHIGRNRIVRRMFESMGYEVVKLDRVVFAGLTKKDVARGHWRHLTEKEVTLLKRAKEPPKATKEERGGKRMRVTRGEE